MITEPKSPAKGGWGVFKSSIQMILQLIHNTSTVTGRIRTAGLRVIVEYCQGLNR
jgi:hypothetical protein